MSHSSYASVQSCCHIQVGPELLHHTLQRIGICTQIFCLPLLLPLMFRGPAPQLTSEFLEGVGR